MTLDLTEDEARALAKPLRQALDYDPYPFAPRIDPLISSAIAAHMVRDLLLPKRNNGAILTSQLRLSRECR